jgi:hypothetical protein
MWVWIGNRIPPAQKCLRTGEQVDEQMLHGVGQVMALLGSDVEGPVSLSKILRIFD